MLYFDVKPCKHETEGTVSARTVQLGTHTTYDKRTTPIPFKVKGRRPLFFKVMSQGHILNIVVKPS